MTDQIQEQTTTSTSPMPAPAKPSRKRRGRGEGELEELPSGKWRATLNMGRDPTSGKRLRNRKTFDTKKQALAWLREQQHAYNQGALADDRRQSVGEWLDCWLTERRGELAVKSYDQYEQHIRLHLKPHLGTIRLSELRPAHISRLFVQLDENGVSQAMRNKVATTLRTALRAAVDIRLIAVNPAVAIKKPRAPKRSDIHPWTAAQARAFLMAADGHRLAPLFILALDTGMRQGELYGLHWGEVDLAAGAVTVARSLQERGGELLVKEVKTSTSRRRLRIAPSTVKALQVHREAMETEGRDVERGPVFCAPGGGYLRKSNVEQRVFRPLMKAAQLERIRFHDLRHTVATLLLLNGVNVKAVSARLGHASVRITLDIYAHVLPEMEDQIVDLTEQVLFTDNPTEAPQEPKWPREAPTKKPRKC